MNDLSNGFDIDDPIFRESIRRFVERAGAIRREHFAAAVSKIDAARQAEISTVGSNHVS